MMTRPGAAIIGLLVAATLAVGGFLAPARADLTIPTLLPPPPPTTTTTTPPGKPVPTTNLVDALLKPPTTPAPATTSPPTTAKPAAKGGTLPADNAGGEGVIPSGEAGPFPADLAAKMRSVRRSAPNNSIKLVAALKALTDLGVPVDEVMRVGMGRFPVAGRATFIDDWWFPRFGPGWRLHEGTDIFADRGTPVRSPANGTVKFSDGGLGGIAVYVYQDDGTYFYMCHLDHRQPGLKPGQRVALGDIVGFVGTTGNAAGGAPHLHFEVHPASRVVVVGKGKKQTTKVVPLKVAPGTELPATDPKPFLDTWLNEALAQVPGLVAAYQASHPVTAAPAGAIPALPAAVVLESHRLSGGGLIAADAPLVRTPLLGLAFLLIVMVVVLTPVLAPRRSLVPVVAAPARRTGRKAGPKRSRRERKAGAPASGSPTVLGAAASAEAEGEGRRGRRRAARAGADGTEAKGRRGRKGKDTPATSAPVGPLAGPLPWKWTPANGAGADEPASSVVADAAAIVDAVTVPEEPVVVDLTDVAAEGPAVVDAPSGGRRRRRRAPASDDLVAAGVPSA